MKKVLCVLLTAFLLIGFSACNNTAKPSEPDSKPQSSSEQSSSDSEPEVKKRTESGPSLRYWADRRTNH